MNEVLPLIAGNFSIVAMIVGLTQVLKQYVPKAYLSLLPLSIGLIIGCIGWVSKGDGTWVIYGIVAALQASGAYSLTKNALEKNQTTPERVS